MLPAAHLPYPPPDWYRDLEVDPFKGKRGPLVWPWLEERPLLTDHSNDRGQPQRAERPN
jgi:hypothetical protein